MFLSVDSEEQYMEWLEKLQAASKEDRGVCVCVCACVRTRMRVCVVRTVIFTPWHYNN